MPEIGSCGDALVQRAVLIRHIYGPVIAHPPGISCASELEAFDPAELRGELEHGVNVFTFEVFVIGQDFLMGHAGTEPFEHGFNRVTQATDAGFAVTDVRVDGDAFGSGQGGDCSRSVSAGTGDLEVRGMCCVVP
jgi:hypothetical protein